MVSVTAGTINRGSPLHNSPNASAEPQPQLVRMSRGPSDGVAGVAAVLQQDFVGSATGLAFVQHPAASVERFTNWQQQRPALRRAGEHWQPAPDDMAQVEASAVAGITAASQSSMGKPSVVSANNSVSVAFPHREAKECCIAECRDRPIRPRFPQMVG